ncbi:MAG: hypothetical protein HY913_12665 [Desulfomonile tiedjei]|nr:hypothetical protein [Desulfomonile tiedjei]
MEQKREERHFVVCIKNEGYAASLEPRKIYRVVPDRTAAGHRLIRVVDESGEDYLYSEKYFAPIRLPDTLIEALSLAL